MSLVTIFTFVTDCKYQTSKNFKMLKIVYLTKKNKLSNNSYTTESDFCMRICCGPDRGFQMHIVDNTGKVSSSLIILNYIQ